NPLTPSLFCLLYYPFPCSSSLHRINTIDIAADDDLPSKSGSVSVVVVGERLRCFGSHVVQESGDEPPRAHKR
ncbi:hypothetical protein AKJ16_DCAP27632, partial [Drosera capensis]